MGDSSRCSLRQGCKIIAASFSVLTVLPAGCGADATSAPTSPGAFESPNQEGGANDAEIDARAGSPLGQVQGPGTDDGAAQDGSTFDAPAAAPPAGPATSAASDAGPPAGQAAADGGEAPAPTDPIAALGHCTGPTSASWSDSRAAYAKWKSDLLTSAGARGFLRVLRPNSPNAVNTSNSEGTAYGMILAVAMDDQPVFDALWKYEQLFLDGNGLMNWEIDPTGSGPTAGGSGAATDADEDMAFALLWADHRWGGQGSLASAYHDIAVKLIGTIWKYEVDPSRGNALAPGDQFGGASVINISYFAPAYYRLFGQVTGEQTNWNAVVESSYTILAATLNAANKNATNGLVPAWSTPAGVPQAPNATLPTNDQLDSCRTPFRMGQDQCWYGEPRAKAYLAQISGFYQQVGASKIVNGYDLDGTPAPTNPTVHQSAAFVGPAGVGAMSDATFSVLRNSAYAGVATLSELDGSLYYTESWTALSLVMMNGGYWNPAPP
jgi:endo-1,4-beta-D-glucanase Y